MAGVVSWVTASVRSEVGGGFGVVVVVVVQINVL